MGWTFSPITTRIVVTSAKAVINGAVILSTVLISSANAVELEDESQNSIFHEVKGNLSFDKFGTSLGLYNGRHSTTIPVVSVPGNTTDGAFDR